MSLTIYGIHNCDTCRKARKFLDEHAIAHDFHDVRKDGLDRALLESWTGAVDWRTLLNTRSTTWRGLDNEQRSDIDERKAVDLIAEHPTLLKRPVAMSGDRVEVGFSPDVYETLG
jgi:arsenate reductase